MIDHLIFETLIDVRWERGRGPREVDVVRA
jgi:hypothetical protein